MGKAEGRGRRRAVIWLAGWGILFTLSEEGRGVVNDTALWCCMRLEYYK